MSGGLKISSEIMGKAVDALYAARDARLMMDQATKAVVNATAPIIVAEAFRKRAHEVEARAVRVRRNNPIPVTESLIDQAQQLRDDADELDPPAVNP